MRLSSIYVLQEFIIALLVLLFVYAGSSKLLDMPGFRAGMRVQPFAGWVNSLLASTLPFVEIVIAAGLCFTASRKVSLFIYALLMSCFTVYTGMVVFGFFVHRPCGCGGIINDMNWEWHFIINIFFLILTLLAMRLDSRINLLRKQGVSRKPVKE